MRVFVAGATGAIGRPLVRQLVAAGHDVTGTSRSYQRAELIRADGAEPAVMDALDHASVKRAVAAARPDAVVHQLTQIPAAVNPRRFAHEFETTNRLRVEGTRHLLVAAHEAGVTNVVAQSIAFAYRHDGVGPKVEEDELIGASAPKDFRDVAESVDALELAVLTA